MARLPWLAPDRNFSWTTLWLNIFCVIIGLRLFAGAGLTVAGFSWNPGEMDTALPAGILAVVSGLYWARRGQEGAAKPPATQPGEAKP